MKKISIVIPIYNMEQYIGRCIESVLCQTYNNIEVCLVNDGSTDSSLMLCEKYAKKEKRIKVVSKENGGLSSARNAGLKIATGDYIMFIDPDDYVAKNYCILAIENIEKYDADISFFSYFQDDSGKKSKKQLHYKNGIISKREAFSICVNDSHPWNKIYKKSLFKNIEFPVNRNFEDDATLYRLIDKGMRFSYFNDATYYYTTRRGSISQTKNNKNIRDAFIVNLERFNYMKRKYGDISNLFINPLVNSAAFYIMFYDSDNSSEDMKKAIRVVKNSTIESNTGFKQRVFIKLYPFLPKEMIKLLNYFYRKLISRRK